MADRMQKPDRPIPKCILVALKVQAASEERLVTSSMQASSTTTRPGADYIERGLGGSLVRVRYSPKEGVSREVLKQPIGVDGVFSEIGLLAPEGGPTAFWNARC